MKTELPDFMMETKGRDAAGNVTIKKLKTQPKVRVLINGKDADDTLWTGSINGVRIHVQKNKFVEVPEAVAELIENNTAVLKDSEKRAEKYTKSSSGIKIADM